MITTSSTAAHLRRSCVPSTHEVAVPELPWLVIVWNDPINLMSYVTYVFQKLFGYSSRRLTSSCSTCISRDVPSYPADRKSEPSLT